MTQRYTRGVLATLGMMIFILLPAILFSQEKEAQIFWDASALPAGSVFFTPADDADLRTETDPSSGSGWIPLSLPLNNPALLAENNSDALGWFYLSWKAPSPLPDQALGLSLGKIADADETFFNGTLIGRTGALDGSRHGCNRNRIYEIPRELLRPGQINHITVRIRTTPRADEAPGRGTYQIASLSLLLRQFYTWGFVQVFFCIIYATIAFLFLLIFLRRRRGVASLFFSIFLFVLGIYTFSRLDIKYLLIDSFEVMQRVEFASLYILLPLFLAFILTYYESRHRWIHYLFYAFSLVFVGVTLLIPDHVMRYQFNVYVVQVTWLIPLLTWFILLIRRFKTNREARLMLGASVFVFAGILHDTLLSRGINLLPSVDQWISPFTFFLFVLSMATIIAGRHAGALREVEELNRTLEEKVKARTRDLKEAMEKIQLKDDQIESELRMAGEVQKALLPRQIPSWQNLDIAVHFEPLREVSGDIYDLITLKDHSAGVLLADASGHGMPAAIYTILAKKAFGEALAQSSDPVEIFRLANAALCEAGTEQYLTAFMLKITPEGQMIYANGGHTKALLLQRRKKRIRFLDTPGSFIGAIPEISDSYGSESLVLAAGDTVLLYTDCLLETTNDQGRPFGEASLVKMVKESSHLFGQELVSALADELRRYAAGAPLKDDLSIIVVERNEH